MSTVSNMFKIIDSAYYVTECAYAASEGYEALDDKNLTTGQKVRGVGVNVFVFIARFAQLMGPLLNWSPGAKSLASGVGTASIIVKKINACVDETNPDYGHLGADVVFHVTQATDNVCTLVPEYFGDNNSRVQTTARAIQTICLVLLNGSKIKIGAKNGWNAIVNFIYPRQPREVQVGMGVDRPMELRVDVRYAEMLRQIKLTPTISDWTSVPEIFNFDQELRKYVCPITKRPIRFVCTVFDPEHQESLLLYERAAVSAHLRSEMPLPSWPANVDRSEANLLPHDIIQMAINQRLTVLLNDYKEINIEELVS